MKVLDVKARNFMHLLYLKEGVLTGEGAPRRSTLSCLNHISFNMDFLPGLIHLTTDRLAFKRPHILCCD